MEKIIITKCILQKYVEATAECLNSGTIWGHTPCSRGRPNNLVLSEIFYFQKRLIYQKSPRNLNKVMYCLFLMVRSLGHSAIIIDLPLSSTNIHGRFSVIILLHIYQFTYVAKCHGLLHPLSRTTHLNLVTVHFSFIQFQVSGL